MHCKTKPNGEKHRKGYLFKGVVEGKQRRLKTETREKNVQQMLLYLFHSFMSYCCLFIKTQTSPLVDNARQGERTMRKKKCFRGEEFIGFGWNFHCESTSSADSN
jgi:hypothetical protein